MSEYPFSLFGDKNGFPYFAVDLEHTLPFNVSAFRKDGQTDIANLLFPFINVTLRATGPFQRDLTKREDVVIAFISLLLLFIIEGLAATLFLRTQKGLVSNGAFSIRMIIELMREFNFRAVFDRSGSSKHKTSKRPFNHRLLFLAISVLLFTISLEIMVLLLSNLTIYHVTNDVATFRLMQPVIPEWMNVNFHFKASINRPCEQVILRHVEPGNTRINGCVTTNTEFRNVESFRDTGELVNYTIVSNMHSYGSDHSLSITNSSSRSISASYQTRAYFTLGDEKSRLMSATNKSKDEAVHIEIVHRQLVAYLFSIYRQALKLNEPNMILERLHTAQFNFDPTQSADEIDVLQLAGKPYKVSPRRYVTTVTGLLPQGTAALRFAAHHFRGLAAVVIQDGPAHEDLFLETGLESRSNVPVWDEQIRLLNWLSLLIIALCSMLVLVFMRFFFKPVAVSEVAAAYVHHCVNAEFGRSPVELDATEKGYFRIDRNPTVQAKGSDYRYGAETEERTSSVTEEYQHA